MTALPNHVHIDKLDNMVDKYKNPYLEQRKRSLFTL